MGLSVGRLPNKCHFPLDCGAATASDYKLKYASLFHEREGGLKKNVLIRKEEG